MAPYHRSASSTRRRRRGVVAWLVAVVLVVPTQASAVVLIDGLGGGEPEPLDARTAVLQPTADQLAAAEALGATVRWNRFGTPQSLIRYGGPLASGVRGADAETAARGWLATNAGLFGLDGTDALELDAAVPLRGTDAQVLVFRQRIDGVLVSPDGILTLGVKGSARSGFDVVHASSSLVGRDALEGERELTAREALVEAASDVGADLETGDLRRAGTSAGWRVFEAEALEGGSQLVRSVAFPMPRRGVVPAYETVVSPEVDEGFRTFVHAETGEVLFRESVVHHAADDPEWETFPSYPRTTPLNRPPFNYPSADTRQLWCWEGLPGCRVQAEDRSPHPGTPWDVDPVTGTPTFTTTGNYAHSQENWFDFLFPGPTGYQPTSSTRTYRFPWTNQWFEERCNPDVLVVGSGNDIDAATTALFVGHNRMHNWAYHLGFTEHAWNAQLHNFGVGTAEGDPLIGMVQAGAVSHGPPVYAGRDNAFMRTLPDGTPSQSAMFLWQPIPGAFYAPCVDGDYDMAVIGHEYTHMIENRMIGKGNRRMGFHAGAMGESVSDFIAMEHMNEYGDLPGGDLAWAVGPYVTGNPVRAIRNYNMSFPSAGAFPEEGRYPRVNPLNFSAVGYDIVGPQVHADGEIWSATNFDIRELFVARYGGGGAQLQEQCANGERPASQCPGNRRWIQLAFDAFLLMPVAPTFLDARDAYLAADMLRFGGANQDLLWQAFARRGFGEHASVTGTQDTEPVPSWESPLHEEATLVFDAVAKDEGGAPIEADVFVGHYEARVTPAARTAAGMNELRILPDTPGGRHRAYEFTAHAEGYGHVRFRVSGLRAGETRNVTIRFPTNVASMHQGAAASGDGADHANLIDDTEGTNWGSTGAPVQGRQVLVDLGGMRTFDRANVSAMLVPGQNRFVALRAFELHACTETAAITCDPSRDAGWTRILTSQDDAFPADNPRPVAPHLILRAFDVPRTTATHVLFRVVDNQCTGQTSFQGDQDDDPRHETDCRIGTPLPERDTEVRAAELQLLSSTPQVSGAQQVE